MRRKVVIAHTVHVKGQSETLLQRVLLESGKVEYEVHQRTQGEWHMVLASSSYGVAVAEFKQRGGVIS